MEYLPDGSFSRNHYEAIQAQLDVIVSEMVSTQQARIEDDITQTYEQSLARSQNTWATLEQTFGQSAVAEQFSSFSPIVPQRTIQALVQVADMPIARFSSEAAQQIRYTLSRSLILGDGVKEAARRLQREGYNTNPGHLQLIARMELSRAQNEAKNDLIEQVNEKHPDLDMWQIIRDRIDYTPKTRNHWFSWAVHNTVRNVSRKEFFEVHEREIAAARKRWQETTGKKIKIGSGGVVWPKFDKGYRGQALPSHYNDRAVLLPWRPAWGHDMFQGRIKHPQGYLTVQNQDLIARSDPKKTKSTEKPLTSSTKEPVKLPLPGIDTKKGSLRGLPGHEVRDIFNQMENHLLDQNIADIDKVVDVLSKPETTFEDAGSLDNWQAVRANKRERLLLNKIRRMIASNRSGSIQMFQDKAPGVLMTQRKRSLNYFNQLTNGQMEGFDIEFRFNKDLARYQYHPFEAIIETDNNATHAALLHELGHWYEDMRPDVLQDLVEFYTKRTDGYPIAALYSNNVNFYDEYDMAIVDHFMEPYMGKVYYRWSDGNERSVPEYPNHPISGTELMSSALELLYNKPIEFAKKEPELFDIIWRHLNG